MIWNYYNISRNLFFLFFSFVIYCFFISHANSQTDLRICDSSNKGWQSTDQEDYPNNFCTTKCSDLRVDETDYPRGDLSSNGYGFCAGSATSSSLTIYRIDLGTSSGDKCTVFEGNITTDFAKSQKGQTIGRGKFKTENCTTGISYDRFYLYINRMQSFAGQTVFPDGSGKIARTTSTCANSDTTATVSDTSWLDTTNHTLFAADDAWTTDNNLCWGKPKGWTNSSAIIKADKLSFLTSVSNSTNALVTYDDFKVFYVGTGTTDSNGFRRESGSDGNYLGVKVDADVSKNIYEIKNGGSLVSGLPIVFENDDKKKLGLKISYYNLKRDDNTTIGVTFLFKRNGSNAELVGFLSGENGMYFTFSYQ